MSAHTQIKLQPTATTFVTSYQYAKVRVQNEIKNFIFVTLIFAVAGDGCDNGELRLADGSTSASGRLEVCFNDIWGAVCYQNWTRMNTDVACRQLGWLTGCESSKMIVLALYLAARTQIFPPMCKHEILSYHFGG